MVLAIIRLFDFTAGGKRSHDVEGMDRCYGGTAVDTLCGVRGDGGEFWRPNNWRFSRALHCHARQCAWDCSSEFLRGFCAGRGPGGNAEHGYLPRSEAVLHAKPSALAQ